MATISIKVTLSCTLTRSASFTLPLAGYFHQYGAVPPASILPSYILAVSISLTITFILSSPLDSDSILFFILPMTGYFTRYHPPVCGFIPSSASSYTAFSILPLANSITNSSIACISKFLLISLHLLFLSLHLFNVPFLIPPATIFILSPSSSLPLPLTASIFSSISTSFNQYCHYQ